MILNSGIEYHPGKDALVVAVAESEHKNAIYINGEWAIPVYEKPIKKAFFRKNRSNKCFFLKTDQKRVFSKRQRNGFEVYN